MKIKDLQIEAHAIAKAKGWHDTERSIGDLIALCHSELSEALEEYRCHPFKDELKVLKLLDKPEGFAIELADTVIRIADMAELFGIDLEEAIKIKMEYNRSLSAAAWRSRRVCPDMGEALVRANVQKL